MDNRRIVVALDVSTATELRKLVKQIPNAHCRAKIGKELFTSIGPLAIEICHEAGLDVFLDLKFHDIPNTCARAVRAAARWGVWMTNIHCSGGSDMMRAAREILEGESHRPLLIGVTVLTSMSEAGHQELGSIRELGSQVDYLASLARDSGLDGVVCSAQEVRRLRQSLGSNFYMVTPGIRPSWAATDDQTRTVTPSEAIAHGSDYLVIGRPITASDHPGDAVTRIIKEL
ncbi:MAG: orotidine-5'-phosphate decarboxylase [Oceanospirillales bacterium TMED33]|nr:orotidine-5'-phosphate decarboxylase [Gammaproteobacteria bacterium]RPG19715.1 MAG: orotidine-5'-phosphate decarboxylase [Oceanospirillales bacterium TMED33]